MRRNSGKRSGAGHGLAKRRAIRMQSHGRTVVDTNVVSYIMQRSPLGLLYEALIAESPACISVVTLEERYYGAEKAKWGTRRRGELEAFISDYLLLPTNVEMAQISGRIRAERARKGRPLSRPDAWIAATALWHGLPVVSHDGDFEDIVGLQVVSLRELRVEEPRAVYGGGWHEGREYRYS